MKWLQVMLATVGVVALFAGAFIVASSATVAAPSYPTENVSQAGIVYVGTNTCFTCHVDANRDGWHALHPQVIQNQVAAPQAILADFSAPQGVRQISASDYSYAYAPEDTGSMADSSRVQRYIVKTEDGNAVLPGAWLVTNEGSTEIESTDWVENCAGCHSPAGKHIRLAQQLTAGASVDELDAVRQAMVTTTQPTVCRRCQNSENLSVLDAYQTESSAAEMTLTSVALADTVDDNMAKEHILQAMLRGKSAAHPIYRRENPTR